jgi:hypothetical protein
LFLATAALPNVGLFDRDQVGDTPLYRSYGDAVLATAVAAASARTTSGPSLAQAAMNSRVAA